MLGGFGAKLGVNVNLGVGVDISHEAKTAWENAQASLEHHENWAKGQASWTIDSVQTQVVAGKNYWYHVTSDEGIKKSVLVHVPLEAGAQVEVKAVVDGHTDATCA